jgi:homocysteine S-methyltransferase
MINPLGRLLDENNYVVSDGAMATELEKRGVDTNSALWSAEALIKDPEAVIAVHRSYFEAGAAIATTDSYQATPQAFIEAGFTAAQGAQFITQSVQLAQAARDEYLANLPREERLAKGSALLIAGSVGPYGAYLADGSEYRGDYTLTDTQYRDFHRERMQLLADAGVDLFAFETMPNAAEVKALCGLLTDEFPGMTAWVSLSVGESSTALCDGTSLAAVVDMANACDQITAVGINCTAEENVTATLHTLTPLTAKPIIVYPNNGDIYNPIDKSWQANPNARSFTALAPEWRAAGARIIGGCCRSTPADIAGMATALAAQN